MRRLAAAVAAMTLIAAPAAARAELAEAPAGVAEMPFASPVVGGDWPDPDITLVDGTYYAIATSGGWAPVFPIMRSTDLREWEIAGSVFPRAPRWTRDSFWAPEMAELPGGGFAVYYSAWPRRTTGRGRAPGGSRYCLGVATAPSPLGPWRDLGRPLRCTSEGVIDPTPVVEDGRLQLVHKADANSVDRPTPILLQRMSADGRRLIGEPRRLIRNRARWERRVVEAPELVRRDGWWHMVYSASLCCGPRCTYAVGAARARRLAGPWRKHPGNPILRGANGWRCPGHISILDDHVAFHAYRSGDLLAGRQMQLAPLTVGADGWPAIGDGRPVGPSADAAPGPLAGDFDEDFRALVPPGTPQVRIDGIGATALPGHWQWPVTHPPAIWLDATGLTLRAPVATAAPIRRRSLHRRPDAAVLARRLGTDRFTATATIDLTSLTGRESAGLAVTRGGPFAVGGQAIGISIAASRDGDASAIVWRRAGRRTSRSTRAVDATGPLVHLRLVANGRRFRFHVSSDGTTSSPAGRARRSPVVETGRIALTTGGQRAATARFTHATLVERR
ncbi:MAG: family 43 glycosylhydrolase [Thermoleophilaceae bacterium]